VGSLTWKIARWDFAAPIAERKFTTKVGVTIMTIRTTIEQRIARCETTLFLAGVVREQVKRQEGKKPSKLLVTAVQKSLDSCTLDIGYHVCEDKDGFAYRIHIWGNKIPYKDRFISTVARSCELMSEAAYTDHNQCYFLNAELLPKLRESLDRLDAWKERLKAILALSKGLEEEMSPYGVRLGDFDTGDY